MKRIKVLSQYTANQIAAGEVVERPASVVKELVENAIDAGSTAITIETKGGGLEYIRVSDNGSGIPAEDVETAFLRHATSKISTAEDLDNIGTLGFRGEALASIAAVSHVTIKTHTVEEEAGTLLRISGGDIQEKAAIGGTVGTTIEVENLFFNVPARLKFVKSSRSEAAYISDYVSRMLLARPDIAFKLIQNGKTVYQSAGDGSLYDAIYCVYGRDVFPHLRELSYDDGYVRLTGYIGTEQAAKNNRNAQSFFINGRYIKSQKLSYALQRAYDMRIMSGRFPFAVLNIQISAQEIDVNVHPNKLDVRFKNEERIMRAATIAARHALGDPVVMPNFYNPDKNRNITNASQLAETQKSQTIPESEQEVRITEYKETEPIKPGKSENVQERPSDIFHNAMPSAAQIKPPVLREPAVSVRPQVNTGLFRKPVEAMQAQQAIMPASPVKDWAKKEPPREAALQQEKTEMADAKALQPEKSEQTAFACEAYSIIGQVFQCYWIVQQNDSVFFIDQHAAHERRLYERFAEKGVAAQSQMLLVPEIVKLSPLDYDTLMDNLPQFKELGFEIEEFGTLTVSVRAVPHLIGQPQTGAFLSEAIGLLDKRNRLSTVELKRAALIQAACKHAVKAGEKLDRMEIEALLHEYEVAGIPLTCPHGRPVMVRMSKLEFEKLFKRVI